MATDVTGATNELIKIVVDAWTGAAAIIGGSCPLMIEHEVGSEKPANAVKGWGRVTVRHAESDTMAMGKRYLNDGTLYVNVFVKPGPKAATLAESVAKLVTRALRYHNGQVRLTRVRQQEAGVEDGWRQVNVLATFDYYERNT